MGFRGRAGRHAGESKFHNGSPTYRTRKQRKRRGNKRESIKAKTKTKRGAR